MDIHLYAAAELGDWDTIRQFESQHYSQRTPNEDTALHILAQFSDSSSTAEHILSTNPKLLLTLNAERQTSLHIAARAGHSNVVRALIDRAKQSNMLESLLRSADKYGSLAMHEAAKGNYVDIVQLFIQEDPTLIYVKNKAKRSPLYIAIEKGHEDVAEIILSNYKQELDDVVGGRSMLFSLGWSHKHFGNIGTSPNGKTVLHAAAIANLPACVRLVSEKLPHLKKKVDNLGCTPLHYAARMNHREVARELLVAEKSMAYVKSSRVYKGVIRILDPSGEHFHKTALHVAVIHGQKQVIEELLSICPDCWQMVTSRKKNVIHLAVEYEQQEVLDFILEKSWASILINQKDCYGNTPLHSYASTENLVGYNLVNHPKIDRNASNSQGLTPLDSLRYPRPRTSNLTRERQVLIKNELEGVGARYSSLHTVFSSKILAKEVYDRMIRTRETSLIVAVLLATITFTAAFTVPGGYDSKDGTPILKHKAAFMCFLAADLLALFSSTTAVIFLLVLPKINDYGEHSRFLQASRVLIRFAFVFMIISFASGLCATMPSSILVSAVVAVSTIFFVIYDIIW